MKEITLGCSFCSEDGVSITHYGNGESIGECTLNIISFVNGKEVDIMLNEESSLKLLEFLKENMEVK